MANIEALDAALAAIDKDPKEWDQQTWARKSGCGTAYCLAGHVVVQAGGEIVWELENEAGDLSAELVRVDGTPRFIGSFASEVLGISQLQRNYLFASDNSRQDLQRMRDALVADPAAELFRLKHPGDPVTSLGGES